MIGPLLLLVERGGVVGQPVNRCTKARKLLASALRRVVGVFLEALARLLIGFEEEPFAD